MLWQILCSVSERDQFFGTTAVARVSMKLYSKKKSEQKRSGEHLGELVLLLEASSVKKF